MCIFEPALAPRECCPLSDSDDVPSGLGSIAVRELSRLDSSIELAMGLFEMGVVPWL
jgi:hypothetical protein